jgi:hypothetical protein
MKLSLLSNKLGPHGLHIQHLRDCICLHSQWLIWWVLYLQILFTSTEYASWLTRCALLREQWAQSGSQWYPVSVQTAAEEWAQWGSQSLQSILLAAGPSLWCSVMADPYFIMFMAWYHEPWKLKIIYTTPLVDDIHCRIWHLMTVIASAPDDEGTKSQKCWTLTSHWHGWWPEHTSLLIVAIKVLDRIYNRYFKLFFFNEEFCLLGYNAM